MTDALWTHAQSDEPVTELDIDVPAWIEQDITPQTIAAIVQGGCASGAYMPAVTYWQALETMSKHGDDVLQYVEDTYGELLPPPEGSSWSGVAVHYLSIAVELWASSVEDEVRAALAATTTTTTEG